VLDAAGVRLPALTMQSPLQLAIQVKSMN